MSRDATIKVRVDARQGKKDLRSLEREFDRTTERAGRAGASMRLGMAATAAGTFAGQAAAGIGARVMQSNAKRALVDTMLDELILAGAGDNAGSILGSLQSRDAVSGRLGKLAGTPGAISDDMIRREFDFEQQFGAGASARGSARIRGVLGNDVRDDALSALVGTIDRLFRELPQAIAQEILRTMGVAR